MQRTVLFVLALVVLVALTAPMASAGERTFLGLPESMFLAMGKHDHAIRNEADKQIVIHMMRTAEGEQQAKMLLYTNLDTMLKKLHAGDNKLNYWSGPAPFDDMFVQLLTLQTPELGFFPKHKT